MLSKKLKCFPGNIRCYIAKYCVLIRNDKPRPRNLTSQSDSKQLLQRLFYDLSVKWAGLTEVGGAWSLDGSL